MSTQEESIPFVETSARHINPGKNVRGQPLRAKRHHTGKMNITHITDRKKRLATFSIRKTTCFKKAKELVETTGASVYIEVKSETKRHYHWETEDFPQLYKPEETSETQQKIQHIDDQLTELESEMNVMENVNVHQAENSAMNYAGTIPGPSTSEAILSPSIMRRTCDKSCQIPEFSLAATNYCRLCGVLHGSEEDFELWMGCDSKECGYWVHTHCVELKNMNVKKIKMLDFSCHIHMQQDIQKKGKSGKSKKTKS